MKLSELLDPKDQISIRPAVIWSYSWIVLWKGTAQYLYLTGSSTLVELLHLTFLWISSKNMPLLCFSFSFGFENFLVSNLTDLFSFVE